MRKTLNEYDFMKVVCILMVVVGHVCSMYTPTGAVVIGVSPVITELRKFIYNVMCHMPIFCAISGAIYCIQIEKGKYKETIPFIKNKIKRLLVPYVIFSTLFVFPTMLYISNIENPLKYYFESYVLTHDTRHLWFLLMLFQMFAVMHFTIKYMKGNETVLLFIFMFLHFFHFDFHQLFRPSYLIWFYLGYYIQHNKRHINHANKYLIITVALFPIILYASDINISYVKGIYVPCLFIALLKIGELMKNSRLKNSRTLNIIISNAMGIFLFHPMVIYLLALFIKTNLTLAYHTSFLILLIASSIISLLLSVITRRLHLSFILGE